MSSISSSIEPGAPKLSRSSSHDDSIRNKSFSAFEIASSLFSRSNCRSNLPQKTSLYVGNMMRYLMDLSSSRRRPLKTCSKWSTSVLVKVIDSKVCLSMAICHLRETEASTGRTERRWTVCPGFLSTGLGEKRAPISSRISCGRRFISSDLPWSPMPNSKYYKRRSKRQPMDRQVLRLTRSSGVA